MGYSQEFILVKNEECVSVKNSCRSIYSCAPLDDFFSFLFFVLCANACAMLANTQNTVSLNDLKAAVTV
jgi:hypothetical protein